MAETDIPTTYKQIVKFGLDKDGFFGLICSSDNGKTVKLIVGPDGLVLHPEDGDKIWNLIESKVQSAIDAGGSQLTWSKISDKPDLVLEKDLPDFNQFAKKNELPDTSGLAKAATVDAVKTTAESALSTAEKAQSTADANSKALADKADRSELPVVPTDLVHTAEMEQARADITKAAQTASEAVTLAKSATVTIDTSLANYAKKSDLPKLDDYAKKTDIPQAPDLTGYAKLTDIPSVTGLVKEAELADYAKLADVPKSMSWSQITGKPILALKSDIPNVSGFLEQADLDGYAKKSDIPKPPDLSGYAKLSDIPKPPDLTPYAKTSEVDEVKATADSALSKAEEAQSTADANSKALSVKANKSEIPDISGLAKKSDIPAPVDLSGYAKTDTVDAVKTVADKAQAIADTNSKLLETKADRKDLPTIPTDLVHSAELDQVRTDVSQAKQDSANALAVAKSASTTLDASKEFVAKNPSEYQEGFSRELKAAGILEVNQTTLGKSLTYSTIGLLTSVAIDSYGSRCVRQRFEVIDSDYPYTFVRTGTGNVWYPWHGITEWD